MLMPLAWSPHMWCEMGDTGVAGVEEEGKFSFNIVLLRWAWDFLLEWPVQ